MFNGILPPIVGGFPWTETIRISDENGIPIAKALLDTVTHTVRIAGIDGCTEYASSRLS